MDRPLDTILTEINNTIKTVSFGSKIQAYNLCYQQTTEEGTFPLLNQGSGQGDIIHWDDTDPLRCYHRLTGEVERQTDTDAGFGKNPSRYATYPLRAVFLGTRNQLTTNNYEDNETFSRDVADTFPTFLTNAEILTITKIEANKNTVYGEEFPDVDLEKLSLDGIAFWVDYDLKVRIC